jgi:hypothetical protein
MPKSEGIERKKDEQPSRIKKPQRIGRWFVIPGVVFIVGVFLIFIALRYRDLKEVPSWVTFLTGSILNLLLLTVVIVQAYIYHRQWAAMQKQIKAAKRGVKIAQQNLIYAQRAYVTIARVEIISAGKVALSSEEETGITSSDEVASFCLRLKIENSGNTPANNVEIFHDFDAREIPPTPSKDAPHWKKIGLIAPHGFSYSYGDRVYDDDINWEILEGEDTGRGIYCWGVLRYRDIFGQTWHTIFNYVQSPYTTSLDSLSPFYPSPSGGNEAE